MIFVSVLGVFLMVLIYVGFCFKVGEIVEDASNSFFAGTSAVLLLLLGVPFAAAAQFHFL